MSVFRKSTPNDCALADLLEKTHAKIITIQPPPSFFRMASFPCQKVANAQVDPSVARAVICIDTVEIDTLGKCRTWRFRLDHAKSCERSNWNIRYNRYNRPWRTLARVSELL